MADYVKLRTHVTAHVRFLEAGAVARDLYVWGMAWSGHQETDGEIPMAALLASAWGAGGKRNITTAQKLVEVGLWERTDTGYRIRKWAEQGNMTKAGLEEKRKAERERKARQRNSSFPSCPTGTPGVTPSGTPASAGSSTSTSLSLSGSDLPDPDLPDRSPTPPESTTEGKPASARYAEAYAAGVSRGKGAPWVWPGTKYAEWDLAKIIKGHAKDPSQKPYRGDQLLRFIEFTAAEFTSAVIADKKAQYYNAFEPRGCLRWLNETDLAEEARRVG